VPGFLFVIVYALTDDRWPLTGVLKMAVGLYSVIYVICDQ
jgi:hypothetical protein